MKLYYHKTDGGAEYLTDKFIECPNGHKEGVFDDANYIVRIDGDIKKDSELKITSNNDLLEACKQALLWVESDESTHGRKYGTGNALRAAITAAERG